MDKSDKFRAEKQTSKMIRSKKHQIGLGCGVNNGIQYETLDHALKNGIRFFDTSTYYAKGALDQFATCLQKNNIPREEVNFCLKLWISSLGFNRELDYEPITPVIEDNLKHYVQELGIDYVDLLVIHWPIKVDQESFPEEFIIEEIWPRLELLVESGLVKAIGVSNFNIIELQRVLNIAKIKPACNQIEFNPFAFDLALKNFCDQNHIQIVAHSPFNFGWKNAKLALLENEVIQNIAKSHQKTPAQIVLAWGCAHGVVPIPGSNNLEHISEIATAPSIQLSETEIKKIDSLNKQDYCYADFGQYFRQKRYLKIQIPNFEAKILSDDGSFKSVYLYDSDFLAEVKRALTVGAGFVILPEIFREITEKILPPLDANKMHRLGRWDGFGAQAKDSIFNTIPEIIELVDDPLISLIVQSLLGWDCKLDNLAASTSRIAPDNQPFGPHQDSPFEQNTGCPLPPAEYPIVLQTIIALDAFTEDNGPLYVIPHSHKKRQRVNLPWSGNTPQGRVPDQALKVIVPGGSAILAVGHLWHGTCSNTTAKPRRGFLIEYVSSICEPRERFTTQNVNDATLRTFSRRMLRLLSNGKRFFYDTPSLLIRYKELLKNEIPRELKAPDSEAKLNSVFYSTVVKTVGSIESRASSDDGVLNIKLGPAAAMGGKGDAPNPEQLFASSYSTSFLRALKLVAGQKLVELPTDVTTETMISFGSSNQGVAIAMKMKVHLPGIEKALAQEMIQTALKFCPYSNAMKGNVQIDLTLD